MVSIYIGIDPGNTTGWFELWTSNGTVSYAELEKNEVEGALESRLCYGPSVVACEQFITTQETAKHGAEDGAKDIEGVVKNTCAKYENCTLVLHTPAEKKRVPDKMLKRLGWWIPNHGHAMDGARHLLSSVASHDPLLFDRIITNY